MSTLNTTFAEAAPIFENRAASDGLTHVVLADSPELKEEIMALDAKHRGAIRSFSNGDKKDPKRVVGFKTDWLRQAAQAPQTELGSFAVLILEKAGIQPAPAEA
jgi:hypothetical protein